jgi:phenylacetic acid degradation operon negative regulatory protein
MVQLRSVASAKALLLTVLGELVLPQGGQAWTRSLIDLLALVGVEEKNARQALARTADQGFVAPDRIGRRVRWGLTVDGKELLTEGTRRIYDFDAGAAAWDGQWVVVLCPVPEDQRAKRHQLRRRLEFAGFGFLSAGVAVSPHAERIGMATAALDELGLEASAVVMRAQSVEVPSNGDLLHRAWDLDALAEQYRSFIRAMAGQAPASPPECAAALVALVHEWRRFPSVDPEIPDELLPPQWPGHEAKAVFDDRHAHWSPAAHSWFAEREAGRS